MNLAIEEDYSARGVRFSILGRHKFVEPLRRISLGLVRLLAVRRR
jgi:hypothetical protein